MKIKIVREIILNEQTIPVDHILEIEDSAGQGLIDSGSAVLYTPEMEQVEEEQIIQDEARNMKSLEKTFKVQTKGIHSYTVKGKNKMETSGMFGKALKSAIDTKAVTSFAGTDATPVLGQIFTGSKILEKTNQVPINGNLNVVFAGALSGSGIGPSVGIIGEVTANATSAPLIQVSCIPGKWFATVAIPNEYVDDVQGMENYVLNTLRKEAGRVLDNSIINGAFTNSIGLKGIVGDAGAVKATVASVTAVTKTELEGVMAKVLPEAQDNSMWVMSPAYWAACQGALMDETNVGGQLIKDGREKALYGYPVVITTAAPSANPLVFGDFSSYTVGFAREMMIEVDRSAAFATDATIAKVSVRAAGALASSTKYYNGTTYGTMCYVGLSA